MVHARNWNRPVRANPPVDPPGLSLLQGSHRPRSHHGVVVPEMSPGNRHPGIAYSTLAAAMIEDVIYVTRERKLTNSLLCYIDGGRDDSLREH